MVKIKNKITLKLSLIIIIFLTLLIGIVIASQFFIVSRLYSTTEYTKVRENNLSIDNDLLADIEIKHNGDKKKITEELNKYADRNLSYYIIVNEDNNIKYMSDNVRELKSIYLENTLNALEDIKNMGPSFRIPSYFNLPSRYIVVSRIIYSDTYMDNEDCILAITKEVYSDENYTVLKTYSLYIFLIAIVCAVILGIIISYIITRPILNINKTAEQISRLDFSKRCTYTSDDELGNLSKNINFLAEKLSNTIDELKDKNTKLEDDLEVQKKIDKLRKEFIADVSHEFKTPLTLIRGFNEVIMSDRVSGDDLKESQNIIIDEVDRMDNLVQELLDLSKVESDTYKLDNTYFDCSELLKNASEKYAVEAKDKNIHIILGFSNEQTIVYGDKNRIEQVIINFISNAVVNAKENGKIILNIEKSDDHITVSVYNDGNHIQESEINRIWDKFYRTDKSRSKKTGGTGLGLAICKRILEKHESNYGAQNAKDGVRFYFTLKTKN